MEQENKWFKIIGRNMKNRNHPNKQPTVHPTRFLIRASSREDYQLRLFETAGRWSPAYQTYYMTHINPEVELYSKWHADHLKFPTTEKSIFSSNNCEHLNYIAAALQDFKEVNEVIFLLSSSSSLISPHFLLLSASSSSPPPLLLLYPRCLSTTCSTSAVTWPRGSCRRWQQATSVPGITCSKPSSRANEQ